MENLLPDGFEEEEVEENEIDTDDVIGYQQSVYFDEESGDFIRDGRFKLQTATGIEAFKQWCINCLQTERYQYPYYGTDFGIETDEAFHAESREIAENILTRQITEALEADPNGRTESVIEISFDWNAPDSVQVYCVVSAIEDVTIDFTVTLDERGR